MSITVKDPNKKVTILSKVAGDRKIIACFTKSINYTSKVLY